jgi:hypothetical protein
VLDRRYESVKLLEKIEEQIEEIKEQISTISTTLDKKIEPILNDHSNTLYGKDKRNGVVGDIGTIKNELSTKLSYKALVPTLLTFFAIIISVVYSMK